MHDFSIDPADEGSHPPGDHTFWNESWYFDFHTDDGRLGGYVRVGLYPALGATWYWACVVGEGRPLVMVADYTAPLPRAPSLRIEHGELRATHTCEVPNERFRCRLEAAARVYSDPAQVYAEGELASVPLSLDLAWETDGEGGYRFRDLARYEIPCRVRGYVVVDQERLEIRGHGQRDHSWGTRDWWSSAWCWNAGRLEDGTRFHSVAPRSLEGVEVPWAAGYVRAPGQALVPISHSSARETLGPAGLPESGRLEVGELRVEVEPKYFAPLRLVDPAGRISHFPRALSAYRAADGRAGVGWIEWNQPQAPRAR